MRFEISLSSDVAGVFITKPPLTLFFKSFSLVKFHREDCFRLQPKGKGLTVRAFVPEWTKRPRKEAICHLECLFILDHLPPLIVGMVHLYATVYFN